MDFSSGQAMVMIIAFKPKAMGSSSVWLTLPPNAWIFLSRFSFNCARSTSGDAGIIFIFTATMPMLFFWRE